LWYNVNIGFGSFPRSDSLPTKLQRAMDLGSERSASSWLVALPIEENNFTLPKGSFQGALCLRYGWTPPHLPYHCVCSSVFSTEHALSWPCKGLPSLRQSCQRSDGANTDWGLWKSTGETLGRTSNTEDGARLDIHVQGFWEDRQQCAFLTSGFLTHLHRAIAGPPSPLRTDIMRTWRGEDVHEVEHGSFTPLVFSARGGEWHQPLPLHTRD